MNTSTQITDTRLQRWRDEWLTAPGTNLLAGLVVALALIPEAISFSVIAGVEPKVGLYASFAMAVTTAITGGRRAMISAATGAMALVVVPLVQIHGVAYLIAATILAGIIQLVLGAAGVGRLMRFVPRPVMVGFVNALAILIFHAQLEHIFGKSWTVLAMVAAGIALLYLLPKITRTIPAPLIVIGALTAITLLFGIKLPNVGHMGALPDTLPILGIPMVPFTLSMLKIILPFSITLAIVGLLESLLTAQLIDDLTDTGSNKDREARGQGIGNIVTGLFGGMASCAMIGQSMINIKAGARTRLSTLSAGIFLLMAVVVFGELVALIPMAALAAIMVVVAVSTFDWSSVSRSTLTHSPRNETVAMVITVVVVVFTHNLAIGVAAGVIASAIFFARRVAHIVDVAETHVTDDGTRVYTITGELFFASTNELIHAFDYTQPEPVIIDLAEAHIWDSSAVAALDAVVARYAKRHITAQLVGLNDDSAHIYGRLTGRYAAEH